MSAQIVAAFVCSEGCCEGCRRCYGMRIGCHARPCRCHLTCSCDLRIDEPDRLCRRHQFRATDGIVSGRRVRAREAIVLDARFDRATTHGVVTDANADTRPRALRPEAGE